MSKIEIPEDLKELIRDDYKVNTPYNHDLITLFKHLFDDYFSPFPVKSTDSFFRDLADDIIEYIGVPNYLRDTTLRNLYYPDRATKSKETLIYVYKFLNSRLSKKTNGKRDGECWVKELKKNKKESFSNTLKKENKYTPTIRGARLINTIFISSMNDLSFSRAEFYAAKGDGDCQWFGIANDWDANRRDRDKIIQIVKDSFDVRLQDKVAVVVTGIGGIGKSTFLRRFAVDIMHLNYLVLWVSNLKSLHEYLNEIKFDKYQKYIIIIEDWDKLKGSQDIANSFLQEATNIDNIRIVIGDRSIIDKEYLDYFDDSNKILLSSDENRQILEEILTMYSDWHSVKEQILSRPEFYNASLYIILFVISRSYSKLNKLSLAGKGGAMAQFKEIVRSDLKKINKMYPGLAKTLFFYANIFKQYKTLHPVHMTWEAFLKLAHHYKSETMHDNVTQKFANINSNHPISNVLRQYLYLEPLLHPDYRASHLFYFHHDLLIEEGLFQSITEEWHFDQDTKFEILNILTKEKEMISVANLYRAFKRTNGFKSMANIKRIQSSLELQKYLAMRWEDLLEAEGFLRKTYLFAKSENNDDYWLRFFRYYNLGRNNHFSRNAIEPILRTILNAGCKSKLIIDTYEEVRLGIQNYKKITYEGL